jgi:lipopolysaccharide transport system ATP-binding protein
MPDTVIRVDGLSKRYRVETTRELQGRLAESLSAALQARVRRLRASGSERPKMRELWALKEVSFEVTKGEVVGIIGRNGAGKTTLLKILSQITEPTEGYAELHGRVGSLLEVGAGFHPELTGRENTFLNGAVLGMSRAEIKRKFDAIVEFAGLQEFIDVPVKRYSSGMFVRLAFAVAAHLEPEILIVDEVLAVGDIEFQKKCLGKMNDVAGEGRTVLFVSHNMAALQRLTGRCLLIENGRLILDAPTQSAVSRYVSAEEMEDIGDVVNLLDHPGRLLGMKPALTQMWMTAADGSPVRSVEMGGEVTVHVQYDLDHVPRQPMVGLTIETITGERIFGLNNKMAPGAMITGGSPTGIFSCHFQRFPVVAGDYFITVAFAESVEANYDKIERAYPLSVTAADVYGTGQPPSGENGHVFADATWTYTPHTLAAAGVHYAQR